MRLYVFDAGTLEADPARYQLKKEEVSTTQFSVTAFLVVHLVGSYVYLGRSPLWDFASLTARNLLAPLAPLPLRLGRLDFAPVVGMGVILLLLQTLPNGLLVYLSRHNLSVWPP